MKEYTEESLRIDVDWLAGYGVDRKEAKKFILNLLKSKMKR